MRNFYDIFVGLQGGRRLWCHGIPSIGIFRKSNTKCVRRFATFLLIQHYVSLYYIMLFEIFVCKGDLKVEEEVLQWLITQKTEDRIELITRVMLETSVEETQYLAVYFCKFYSIFYNHLNNIRYNT